jgi:hypothetical protein
VGERLVRCQLKKHLVWYEGSNAIRPSSFIVSMLPARTGSFESKHTGKLGRINQSDVGQCPKGHLLVFVPGSCASLGQRVELNG